MSLFCFRRQAVSVAHQLIRLSQLRCYRRNPAFYANMDASKESVIHAVNVSKRLQLNRSRPGAQSPRPGRANENSVEFGHASRFSSLPLQVQRHISYFLNLHVVYTADELSRLVESYPLEYFCVELHLPKEEESAVVLVLEREHQLLREVVVPQSDYSEYALLVKELFKLQSLECLSLQLHNISPAAAKDLVQQSCSSRNKHHFLDLDLSLLPAGKSSDLIEELVRGDKSLTYLDLRRIEGWKDVHNKYLSPLASKKLKISHLQFLAVEFGKLGAHLLANALAGNCSLRSVMIGDGPIGDEGVVLIGKALAKNKVLRRFRGYTLGMSPEGAAQLANALSRNNTLSHFTLRDEDVGVEGAKAFAALLKRNRSLRTLSLNYCNLGEEGCHWITNAVQHNDFLEELELMYNEISDSDANRLLEMTWKPWWFVRVDDWRVIKPSRPRRPILAQRRETFKANFREYISCIGSSKKCVGSVTGTTTDERQDELQQERGVWHHD